MSENAIRLARIRNYARLVFAGTRTLEEVPEEYRQAVKDYLAELKK